jgi:L-threonylcarbamoyladenylate synthase
MIKITVEELIKLTKEDIKGKVIVFPTDTVYGIGAMIDDQEGVNKIYNLKHRDKNKPLANLAYSSEQIEEYVNITNPKIKELMKHWPGALTIIFNKKHIYNNELPTIAFRIPNSNVALTILKRFGVMSVTSMNLSGSEPLNNLYDIIKNFESEIDYLVTNEEKHSNISSTIIDVTKEPFVVLRKGEILKEINV